MREADWKGCYDGRWQGTLNSESLAHPAKYARGLIERIIRTGFGEGWWAKGDVLGDCFAGVGCGGIVAAYAGLRWIGVELEERFVGMCQRNFDAHRQRWERAGDPQPVVIQGDSRRFAELVGQVAGIVTSPPYAEDVVHGRPSKMTQDIFAGRQAATGLGDYGTTPGQIGAMKEGKLAGVVTSPPYAESVKGDHAEKETAQESRDKRRTEGGSLGQSQRHGGYGATEGNLGNLPEGKLAGVVTSPPYADSAKGEGEHGFDWSKVGPASGNRKRGEGTKHEATLKAQAGGYGDTPGNLGNMPEGRLAGVVTSPPWENQEPSHAQSDTPSARRLRETATGGRAFMASEYGETDGQLGNTQGDTYWQAVATVYDQCRIALRPGGVMVVVVKDYVRDKKRVPLCDNTAALLQSLGFTIEQRIQVWLVSEQVDPGLFGNDVVKRTERKSFFRRLAERKGSPHIDWEEVIVARTPDATAVRRCEEARIELAGNRVTDGEHE